MGFLFRIKLVLIFLKILVIVIVDNKKVVRFWLMFRLMFKGMMYKEGVKNFSVVKRLNNV